MGKPMGGFNISKVMDGHRAQGVTVAGGENKRGNKGD